MMSGQFDQLRDSLRPGAEFVSLSEDETVALGTAFGQALDAACTTAGWCNLLLLQGEMGAGKTAFVRGLAAGLGIEAGNVQSPTFTLVNEYSDSDGRVRLVHCDLYRLEDTELEAAGVYDALSRQDCVVVVEWSERLPAPIPGAVTLRFSRGALLEENPTTEAGIGEPSGADAEHTRRVTWVVDQ